MTCISMPQSVLFSSSHDYAVCIASLFQGFCLWLLFDCLKACKHIWWSIPYIRSIPLLPIALFRSYLYLFVYTFILECHNREQLDQPEVQLTICVYKLSINQKPINYRRLRTGYLCNTLTLSRVDIDDIHNNLTHTVEYVLMIGSYLLT